MENTEPFECCPSLGRKLSKTAPVNRDRPAKSRNKSANPIDKVFEKLSSKSLAPLSPFGEMLFKVEKNKPEKVNREKAKVPDDTVKPYKRWLENWKPGDPLPLVPPGFKIDLCADLGGNLLSSGSKQRPPRFATMNESDIAGLSEKSLGSALKDTVYTLRAAIAKSRGLWVDAKNKLRCSFGPNANQYTDAYGSNCFVPVRVNPPNAVPSGGRLARRTADAELVGAMKNGARKYKDGYDNGGLAGDREFSDRGRDMVAMSEELRRTFRDGLFVLPSGRTIRHYKRTGLWGNTVGDEGRKNFLYSVAELFPSVDLDEAGKFWDNLITDDTPLTTLQKVKLEDQLDGFFQSLFMEAMQNPEKARWVTSFSVDMNMDDSLQIQLAGDAVSQTDKKGRQIVNPNEPISESGFSFTAKMNPVALYYQSTTANTDPDWTAAGGRFQSPRSHGMYTATHEFGHIAHFGRAMENLGFDPTNLGRTKSGSWKIDLRNIQNPNNLPQVARLQAMVNNLERLQTGSRWTTLASGQRVRVYAKDVKEAVLEFYNTFNDTIIKDLGGTNQDFELLKNFIGAKYARMNLIETRAEAWAAVRMLGPKAILNFAREHSIYQNENPQLFTNPQSANEIENNIYQAMSNIFGSRSRDKWHERRDMAGFSPVTGTRSFTTTPTGVSRFMPSTLRSSQPNNRSNIPMRTPGQNNRPNIPMGPPGQNTPGASGSMRSSAPNLTGAMASTREDATGVGHTNNKTIITYAPNFEAAEKKTAENIVDMLEASKVLDGPIEKGRLTIEQRNALSKIVETVGTSVDTQDNISKDNLSRISLRPGGSQLMKMVEKVAESFAESVKSDPTLKTRKQLRNKEKKAARYETAVADLENVLNKFKRNKDNTRLAQIANEWAFSSWGSEYVNDISNPSSEKSFLDAVGRTLDVYRDKLRTLKADIAFAPFWAVDSKERATDTMSVKKIINDIKNSAQEHVLGVLSATDQVNKRFPWMRNSSATSFGLDMKELSDDMFTHFQAAFEGKRFAKVSRVNGGRLQVGGIDTGRIIADIAYTLQAPGSDLEKENIAKPDFNYFVGSWGSTKVRSANLAYHELGHLADHLLKARGYGLQSGPNSPKIIEQLKDVGPELGDTVVGALFAFNTGKTLDTKIDSFDEVDETALLRFLEQKFLFLNKETSGPTNFRLKFLAGLNIGKDDDEIERWSYNPDRRHLVDLGGDSKDVRADFASAEKILSDALGWDLEESPIPNLRELHRQAEQTSLYAQTSEAEAFAELFALMMQIEQYGQANPDDLDAQKPRQLVKMMSNAIDNSVSHDKPAALSFNQKQELQRLQKKLNSLAHLEKERTKKLIKFDKINLSNEERSERSSWSAIDAREIKVIDLDNESIPATDVKIPYEWENSNGLIGRMASFQTSDDKTFLLDEDGRVVSTSGRVVFVDGTELDGLRFAPRYETPTFTRYGIVGAMRDETNLNKTTFAKLRERGESFDSAFVRAGGKSQKKLVPLSSKPDIGLHPVRWNDKTGKFDISGEITSITMAPDSSRGVVGRMADEHGFSGELTQVRNAFKQGTKPPQKISIPSDWFIQDPKIDAENRARQAYPDIHMRYEEQYGMRRYVPATGKLKDDADGAEKMVDTDRAGFFLWRKYWMPSIAYSKSELGEVLYYWRNSYSQSRALALSVGGYSENIAEAYRDDADFLKKSAILKNALAVAPPMGTKTYRTMRLTDDVGQSANVGDELNFDAAAVAWSQKTAMQYDLDELSMAPNVPDKLLMEFPADARGILHDELGLKQGGKYYAKDGDQAPVEGIVSGRFKISRIEERTLTNPRTGKDVKRKVHVLTSLTGAMSGRRKIKSDIDALLDEADLNVNLANERLQNLKLALKDFKQTGYWRGTKYGVVLGINDTDIIVDGKNNLDEDIEPMDQSPTMLEIRKTSRNDMIERIERKIEIAEIEARLQIAVAEKKLTRMSQNTLDIEDIPPDELVIMKKEQKALESLWQSDRKRFWQIMKGESWLQGTASPEEKEMLAAIYTGPGELNDGVVNASKSKISADEERSRQMQKILLNEAREKLEYQRQRLVQDGVDEYERQLELVEFLEEQMQKNQKTTPAIRLGFIDASAKKAKTIFNQMPDIGVPEELRDDSMRQRWTSLMRGTQYLFVGQKDEEMKVNPLTAGSPPSAKGGDILIIGSKKPLFGLSERINSQSSQIDEINLAVFARAVSLQKAPAGITRDGVIGTRVVSMLTGAMSDGNPPKKIKSKRELAYLELKNAWRTKDPSQWTDQDVYYARLSGVTITEIAERLNIPRSDVRRRKRNHVKKMMKLNKNQKRSLSIMNPANNDIQDLMARWTYGGAMFQEKKPETPPNKLIGSMATKPNDWPNYDNFYSVLGVARNSSLKDMRKAYIEKVKVIHPDVDKTDGATERFQELQLAFETLSDDLNKRQYDEWLDRQGIVDETPNDQTDPFDSVVGEESVEDILREMRWAQEQMRRPGSIYSDDPINIPKWW